MIKIAHKIERRIKHSITRFVSLNKQNRKLRKFRNYHKGEDCVILGSGPSLNDIPHEFLDKFVVFGANLSFKYHKPDYWVVNDAQFSWVKEGRKMCYKNNIPAFISWVWADKPEISYTNEIVMYPYRLPTEQSQKNLKLKNHLMNLFNNPLCLEKKGMSGVNNVLTEGAIPLALYMGFERIFLAGVDFYVAENNTSHFMNDKLEDQKKINDLTDYLQQIYNSKHDRFYHKRWGIEIISESKNGHKIFNLSEKSTIQKIPKVNYKDIIIKKVR